MCVSTRKQLSAHSDVAEGVRARRGVVLAGGGFPANPALRQRYLPHPVAEHTAAVVKYQRGGKAFGP